MGIYSSQVALAPRLEAPEFSNHHLIIVRLTFDSRAMNAALHHARMGVSNRRKPTLLRPGPGRIQKDLSPLTITIRSGFAAAFPISSGKVWSFCLQCPM